MLEKFKKSSKLTYLILGIALSGLVVILIGTPINIYQESNILLKKSDKINSVIFKEKVIQCLKKDSIIIPGSIDGKYFIPAKIKSKKKVFLLKAQLKNADSNNKEKIKKRIKKLQNIYKIKNKMCIDIFKDNASLESNFIPQTSDPLIYDDSLDPLKLESDKVYANPGIGTEPEYIIGQ